MINLLIVFFLTFVVGFFLIFFIQKTSPKKTTKNNSDMDPLLQDLDFDQFYGLCCDLLEKFGLKIKESYRDQDNTADIYAENPQPFVGGPVVVRLVLYPPDGQINTVDVMNFSSDLVGDRRGKGLFITTGTFAPEIGALPELPPMDFIDGKKLTELFEKHELFPKKALADQN